MKILSTHGARFSIKRGRLIQIINQIDGGVSVEKEYRSIPLKNLNRKRAVTGQYHGVWKSVQNPVWAVVRRGDRLDIGCQYFEGDALTKILAAIRKASK